MQIIYLLKEGFSGFKRAKISATASIVSICISLLLLSLFAILFINVEGIINDLRNKVEIEAFLSDQLTDVEIEKLKNTILAIEGVKDIRYISKKEAAKIFYEEFGEDIYKVLNFNPLPASFKIMLHDGYKTLNEVQKVIYHLRSIQGIEDLTYRKQLLELLDQQGQTYLWILLGIGIFLTLSAILLVANTIRLVIYAKRDIIRTMKLIGATRRFIRTPFIIEGFLQGLIGGIISCAILYMGLEYLRQYLTTQMLVLIHVELYYYGVVICIGCFLGILGSIISVRRFIKSTIVQ